jgi:hypothetical protein
MRVSYERRNSERIPVSFEVNWEGASGKYESRISDISETGCYIESFGQTSMGEIIKFEVVVSSEKRLNLQGEVVYSLPNMGFGLRFISLTESQKLQIAELLRDLSA